jgi:hypothetical protein
LEEAADHIEQLQKVMELHRDAHRMCVELSRKEVTCQCGTCRPIDWKDPSSVRMILCPECGNKRCPKALHHDCICTRSNDTDQEPRAYKASYDAYYNPITDEWLESPCGDPTCDYCNARPERPSEI